MALHVDLRFVAHPRLPMSCTPTCSLTLALSWTIRSGRCSAGYGCRKASLSSILPSN
jgi:hypothetical protein